MILDNGWEISYKEVSEGDFLLEARAAAIETWYDGETMFGAFWSRSC